ncbi:hypothetical protein [Haloferula sp. A504]|uniref:hypothetical protein n=1 Tax=Haloferula sp. A504 TaxID=3373601 RepID=UPI0031CB76B2|nr:hypothetical protein [Verrucomicrobiaceae bacterium E54]
MPSETIQNLRQQLREKFPAAHREGSAGVPPAPFGVPPNASTHPDAKRRTPLGTWNFEPGTSNFPIGAITEISPAHPACGLTLLFAALLSEAPNPGNTDLSAVASAKAETPALVLIDARDRFDPASFSPEECRRLLWLRCRETRQALQSADLLLRDGNLPFILLDLSPLPARELRRIPGSAWHRLRQLAEPSQCTLLVLTPTPLVPGAALRLTLTREFDLRHLDLSRTDLLRNLHAEARHRHRHTA